jgi:hypothetical protein
MWLLQLPSRVRAEDREAFGRDVLGATRERMLREMGDALDALTAEAPLVLVLEDLHWSDYSTLDLISYVARQRREARLMVVGTYRPAELIASGHPLKAVKQELAAKQQCAELPLEYLNEQAVAEYLAVRFPAHRLPGELAALIHDRTEGNPLFMVNTVDYLVGTGLIGTSIGLAADREIDRSLGGVPDSIRNLIERQIDHLPSRQRMLEPRAWPARSSPYAVAAAPTRTRQQSRARARSWGGAISSSATAACRRSPAGSSWTFQLRPRRVSNVLYDRISAARRVLLHKRLAMRGEQVWRARKRDRRGARDALSARQTIRGRRGTSSGRSERDAPLGAREAIALPGAGSSCCPRCPTPDRIRPGAAAPARRWASLWLPPKATRHPQWESALPGQSTLRSMRATGPRSRKCSGDSGPSRSSAPTSRPRSTLPASSCGSAGACRTPGWPCGGIGR